MTRSELSEDWSSIREPVIEGVPFYVKYLGSSLVQKSSGEDATSEAIKTIVAMARNRKLHNVKLTISLKGIHMMDLISEETTMELSIYRISYCSADATYDRVFAFIATNKNETLECHAFLCPKRKMAQSATLTIAQAFNLAFELWQASQERKRRRRKLIEMKNGGCCRQPLPPLPCCVAAARAAKAAQDQLQAQQQKQHDDLTNVSNSCGANEVVDASISSNNEKSEAKDAVTVSTSSSSSSGYNSSIDASHCSNKVSSDGGETKLHPNTSVKTDDPQAIRLANAGEKEEEEVLLIDFGGQANSTVQESQETNVMFAKGNWVVFDQDETKQTFHLSAFSAPKGQEEVQLFNQPEESTLKMSELYTPIGTPVKYPGRNKRLQNFSQFSTPALPRKGMVQGEMEWSAKSASNSPLFPRKTPIKSMQLPSKNSEPNGTWNNGTSSQEMDLQAKTNSQLLVELLKC